MGTKRSRFRRVELWPSWLSSVVHQQPTAEAFLAAWDRYFAEKEQMQIIRIVYDDREFYVTEEAWQLFLKECGNRRDALLPLLIKAEAIAAQESKPVRIITKYVN